VKKKAVRLPANQKTHRFTTRPNARAEWFSCWTRLTGMTELATPTATAIAGGRPASRIINRME
jgi:hypothetical protein